MAMILHGQRGATAVESAQRRAPLIVPVGAMLALQIVFIDP
jgi:hypothetical protein